MYSTHFDGESKLVPNPGIGAVSPDFFIRSPLPIADLYFDPAFQFLSSMAGQG